MSTASIGFDGTFASPRRLPAARSPRLRLTRRGRAVFTGLAAVPLVIAALVLAFTAGPAAATLDAADANFEYVTVEAGQSMWQLAGELAPQADPREVIDRIVQLNQLESSDVYAGQQLALPLEYSGQNSR
jgi:hypothetical protein